MDLTPLATADLLRLAQAGASAPCPQCAALVCPGWETLPSTFDQRQLACVGTLRQPGRDDPTVAEYHPGGTHGWSADAPIAPAWFPYNRCDAWVCVGCARPFLRYTEYGGYYSEMRVRQLRAELLADVPADAT